MKKYSKITYNWSCFPKDILNSLIERFEKLKVDKKFCIPDLLIKDTIYRLLNYVGCKSVFAHLSFCKREFGENKNCSFCTILVLYNSCFQKEDSDIFDELDNIKLKHVLSEVPDYIESVFNFLLQSRRPRFLIELFYGKIKAKLRCYIFACPTFSRF